MKRIISFLAAAALVFGTGAALPEGAVGLDAGIMASAKSYLTYGDYKYNVLDDGTVEICVYIGSDEEVIIPATLNGKKVTALADSAFSDINSDNQSKSLNGIKKIVVPDSVTKVGMYAFANLRNLKEITFPDTITEIPSLDENNSWGAFEGCTSLEKVKLPKNLKKIGNKAFYRCSSLKEIELPETITDIEWSAFAFCISLESIKIPQNVKTIEQDAFYECIKLKSIDIPESVTSIGEWCFGRCESLSEVTLHEGLKTIEPAAFKVDNALKSITVPKSVEIIDSYSLGCSWDSENEEEIKIDGFTIYGYSGTAAEEYANKNGFTFIPLDAIPGDADGNGDVTVDDVLLIQQKIAGWDVKINEAAADIDGDGELSVSDALAVQQIIAGWKIG